MNADKLISILAAIVGVTMVTTIVSHPESANVITSFGNAFSSSLRAAQGK